MTIQEKTAILAHSYWLRDQIAYDAAQRAGTASGKNPAGLSLHYWLMAEKELGSAQ